MVGIVIGWPLPVIQRGSITTILELLDAMPDRHDLRIVVVDDNYDANAALSRLIEAAGFQIVGRAYDGMAGLTTIKDAQPDVAILDIAMPKLDGYELARRIIDEMESPPHLVAITGFGKESDKAEATSAGFDAYFRSTIWQTRSIPTVNQSTKRRTYWPGTSPFIRLPPASKSPKNSIWL